MLSITRPVLTSSFRLLFRYQDGIRIPGSTLMELRYNASQFTPSCTAEHARDFCSPCSTVIDHHHIMCYNCFNQSFATLPNATDYAQVRLPIDRRRRILTLILGPVESSVHQLELLAVANTERWCCI
jgi:hypothetical protein